MQHAVLALLVWSLIAPTMQATQGDTPQAPEPAERVWNRDGLIISLRLDNPTPFAADPLNLQLAITAPEGYEVEWPKLDHLPRELHTAGVQRDGPRANLDGSSTWQVECRVEVLEAGGYEIPPLEIRYRQAGQSEWETAATEPVKVQFVSLLGDDPAKAELRPNPGPAELPRRAIPWLWLCTTAVLLAALAMAAIFLRNRRIPKKPAPVPRVSAYRKAMAAIDRVASAGWLERGELDKFYTELSRIIRHYVEDRFGVQAPEQTTEEFLVELAHRPILAQSHRELMSRFLEQCDLVKFAQARPGASEGQAALKAAHDFVEQTRDESILVEVP